MKDTPSEEIIRLEYRVAILEGVVSWMLTSGVFVKSISFDEMQEIHYQALKSLRRRYPEAEIKLRLDERWRNEY